MRPSNELEGAGARRASRRRTRAWLFPAFAAAAFCVSGACGVIIGIDDRTLDPGPSGTRGGNGGSGAASTSGTAGGDASGGGGGRVSSTATGTGGGTSSASGPGGSGGTCAPTACTPGGSECDCLIDAFCHAFCPQTTCALMPKQFPPVCYTCCADGTLLYPAGTCCQAGPQPGRCDGDGSCVGAGDGGACSPAPTCGASMN
jgi:hypothetical protein